jgi:hypothetical protein
MGMNTMAEQEYQGEVIAERRKAPRFPLKLQVRYTLANSDSSCREIPVQNIGCNGLAMLGDQAISLSRCVRLQLFLPKHSAGLVGKIVCPEKESQPVELEGRVIWSTPFGNKFIFGIVFVKINRQQSGSLREFLRYYELDQPSLTF